MIHQHPQTLTLLVLKQAQKPKSKLNDSKEMLAQVLLCSIECTKSNPFLPCTHVGLRISKSVHQMIIYPQFWILTHAHGEVDDPRSLD